MCPPRVGLVAGVVAGVVVGLWVGGRARGGTGMCPPGRCNVGVQRVRVRDRSDGVAYASYFHYKS